MNNRLPFSTKNLTQENIEKLSKIFPNVVKETKDDDENIVLKVDFELLQQELSNSIIETKETYNINWVGKFESIVNSNSITNNTLRPQKELSKNWDTTQNSILVGDNLEILKILRESYLNKIKMIYIDPPYNTGGDFIYNDKFATTKKDYEKDSKDEEGNRLYKNTNTNGRFHSNWLSMMNSRLRLAKDLLTDDGVIFISIDDREIANLKLLCDEIFGEENLITQIIWKNHNSPSCNTTGKKMINVQNEYILMYSKKKDFVDIQGRELTNDELKDRGYILEDEYLKERGFYTLTPLSRKSTSGAFQYVKSLDYEIEAPDGTFFKNHANKIIKENACYTWSKETFEAGSKLGFIEIKKNKDGDWVAYRKMYSKVYFDPKKKIMIKQNQNEEYKNIIEIPSSNGTKDISKLFNDNSKIFDFPKPVKLIKTLINIIINKNDNSIILDFFAGSGTTGQAVMELNSEDDGNRKFILCQIDQEIDNKEPAYNFCKEHNLEPVISSLTIERVNRAGEIVKKENDKIDVGYRVFKLDSSNMNDVYYSPKEYSQNMLKGLIDNIKEDRTPEDLLYSCILQFGLELNYSHEIKEINGFKIHIVDEGTLMACFDENLDLNTFRKIADLEPNYIVFRDSSFKNDADKISVIEIFKAKMPHIININDIFKII